MSLMDSRGGSFGGFKESANFPRSTCNGHASCFTRFAPKFVITVIPPRRLTRISLTPASDQPRKGPGPTGRYGEVSKIQSAESDLSAWISLPATRGKPDRRFCQKGPPLIFRRSAPQKRPAASPFRGHYQRINLPRLHWWFGLTTETSCAT
ncbi:hypothetical protein KM043_011074 [Ampulex compressa]|nr:hypothetical protein KM043_011074 [Ampulex compressa]